jgi:hypothetical protein
MDRRGFLKATARAGSALLIVPAGGLAACGNSKDPTIPYAPLDGLRFTSDIAGIHTHDFTIATDDLDTPEGTGVQGPTTVALGHKHEIRLTQEELARIGTGATLNKATSIVDGHSHNFKFSLAVATPQGTVTSPTSSPDGSSSSGT